eukprot:CAMPEP_0170604942 /NCGR_PEP_ID=MMETSP0224-20130122/19709_1 /TAXON_ID=285029 /ORGANISM="Togula jolla, Strain CCCM 725" /LENGTH=644 /DNA_ID=CAMNT_0010929913 /DNA_START=126 /DNA_END=2060 /DNA_ORIENTATION=+
MYAYPAVVNVTLFCAGDPCIDALDARTCCYTGPGYINVKMTLPGVVATSSQWTTSVIAAFKEVISSQASDFAAAATGEGWIVNTSQMTITSVTFTSRRLPAAVGYTIGTAFAISFRIEGLLDRTRGDDIYIILNNAVVSGGIQTALNAATVWNTAGLVVNSVVVERLPDTLLAVTVKFHGVVMTTAQWTTCSGCVEEKYKEVIAADANVAIAALQGADPGLSLIDATTGVDVVAVSAIAGGTIGQRGLLSVATQIPQLKGVDVAAAILSQLVNTSINGEMRTALETPIATSSWTVAGITANLTRISVIETGLESCNDTLYEFLDLGVEYQAAYEELVIFGTCPNTTTTTTTTTPTCAQLAMRGTTGATLACYIDQGVATVDNINDALDLKNQIDNYVTSMGAAGAILDILTAGSGYGSVGEFADQSIAAIIGQNAGQTKGQALSTWVAGLVGDVIATEVSKTGVFQTVKDFEDTLPVQIPFLDNLQGIPLLNVNLSASSIGEALGQAVDMTGTTVLGDINQLIPRTQAEWLAAGVTLAMYTRNISISFPSLSDIQLPDIFAPPAPPPPPPPPTTTTTTTTQWMSVLTEDGLPTATLVIILAAGFTFILIICIAAVLFMMVHSRNRNGSSSRVAPGQGAHNVVPS